MANIKVGDCVVCSLDSFCTCYVVLDCLPAFDLCFLNGHGSFDGRWVLFRHLRKIEG